jgi:hypothetical protein
MHPKADIATSREYGKFLNLSQIELFQKSSKQHAQKRLAACTKT